MELLFFLKISVVLSYSFKSKLVHEVNELRVWNVFLLEASDGHGISCREERNLLIGWHDLNNLCGNYFEIIRKKLVDLIKNKHLALVKLGDSLRGKIEDSTGSGNYNMNSLVEPIDVLLNWITSC